MTPDVGQHFLPFIRRIDLVNSRSLHDSPLRPREQGPRLCLLYLYSRHMIKVCLAAS